MRSRYSAYVLGLVDYLAATWHPSTRPADLAPLPAGLRWLGLEVRRHEQQDEDHALVEFVARSKQGGGSGDNVVDADFEEVKDDKKKSA